MKSKRGYNLTPYYTTVYRTVCAVMLLFAGMCLLFNLLLLNRSHNWLIISVNLLGIFSSVGFFVSSIKAMTYTAVLSTQKVINRWTSMAFVCLLIALIPILLYLLLGDQWLLVNKYGFISMVVNGLGPYYHVVAIPLLFAVTMYWMTMIFVIKGSATYKMIHNKKIEIHENK